MKVYFKLFSTFLTVCFFSTAVFASGDIQYIYTKPSIDLLLVWDNSASSFLSRQKNTAFVNQVLNQIHNDRFNYNLLVSPLIGNGLDESKLVSSTISESSLNSNLQVDHGSLLDEVKALPIRVGEFENGLKRVSNLLELSQSNSLFREESYKLVIIISNGDDISWVSQFPPTTYEREHYIENNYEDLLNLTTKSNDFRFISLVNHANCDGTRKINNVYKAMSEKILRASSQKQFKLPIDHYSFQDSLDLCRVSELDLSHILNYIEPEIIIIE